MSSQAWGLSATLIQSPLIGKDGRLTPEWQRWFTSIRNVAQNFDPQSIFQGSVGSDAQLEVRGIALAILLQNIDNDGVVTKDGIDFARNYLNQTTQYIGDGPGSPLAGGEAFSALVATPPTLGQVPVWNGARFIPETLASGGVTSVNAQTGAVSLVAGSNVTITPGSPSAGDITIAATGGGGGLPVNNPTFTGTMAGPHYEGNGPAPGIAVGSGAGTGGSASLVGTCNDSTGSVRCAVGTGPSISSPLFTVTLNAAYSRPPRVFLMPTDAATAGIANLIYAAPTDSQHWVAYTNSAGIIAATYNWSYLVIA